MLAYDYPLLGIFWTIAILFVWAIWLLLLFYIFRDIFRSHEMGGFAKVVWIFFIIIVPFFGVLVYLIVHGGAMSQHQPQTSQGAIDNYARVYAGGGR